MQQTTYLFSKQIQNVKCGILLQICNFCRKTLKFFKADIFVFRRLELIPQFLKCLFGDVNTDYMEMMLTLMTFSADDHCATALSAG